MLRNWSVGSPVVKMLAFHSKRRRLFSLPLYFFLHNNTSDYSEIHLEHLSSELFLLYNYRASTLRGISRKIGWLLWQCRKIPVRIIIVQFQFLHIFLRRKMSPQFSFFSCFYEKLLSLSLIWECSRRPVACGMPVHVAAWLVACRSHLTYRPRHGGL